MITFIKGTEEVKIQQIFSIPKLGEYVSVKGFEGEVICVQHSIANFRQDITIVLK